MKKLGLFMLAFAAVTMLFSSCKKEKDGPNLDEVIEDGFYVGGPATGTESLQVAYRLASGLNEVDKSKRAGMYEKYVALEANKDFYLLLREASLETRYSAEMDTFSTGGVNDQPTITLQRGVLKTGETAPAMRVDKSGLYHIVLDLNEAGDLADPMIILAPVDWGTRGVNGDWGWKAMEGGEFNRTEMVWTATFDTVKSAGDFKFAYGGGWKIQLDDAGNVKANTNLGLDMLPNGENIPLQKGTDVKIVLTWKLNGGEISSNYSMSLTGKFETEDPTQFVVGFSGEEFLNEAGENWKDPSGAALAVYNAEKSEVTDETTKKGTYVYDITGLTFTEGKPFKARVNGAWLGFNDVTIEGGSCTEAPSDGNILIGKTAAYDVEIVVEWNGVKAAKVTLKFTEK